MFKNICFFLMFMLYYLSVIKRVEKNNYISEKGTLKIIERGLRDVS